MRTRDAMRDDGTFLAWIAAEFSWKKTQAYCFMQVAEASPNFGSGIANFDVSALYLLARPSMPEPALPRLGRHRVAASLQAARIGLVPGPGLLLLLALLPAGVAPVLTCPHPTDCSPGPGRRLRLVLAVILLPVVVDLVPRIIIVAATSLGTHPAGHGSGRSTFQPFAARGRRCRRPGRLARAIAGRLRRGTLTGGDVLLHLLGALPLQRLDRRLLSERARHENGKAGDDRHRCRTRYPPVHHGSPPLAALSLLPRVCLPAWPNNGAIGGTLQAVNRSVSRAFEMSRRRDNVSWSAHAELASVEDANERHTLLDRAAEEGWTKRQARAEVARLKNAQAIGAPAAGDGTCTVA